MDWLRDKVDKGLDQIQARLGYDDLEEPENQTLLAQFNEATTLTRTQRLLGFAVCFAVGMLLSLLAPAFILRPVKLATTLTLGNMLSVGSMLFLVGPSKQCATMFDEKRRWASAVYLGSLVLTLLAAFALRSRLVCLACIILQYAALIWYSLSYIPYGQAFALRLLGRGDPGEI